MAQPLLTWPHDVPPHTVGTAEDHEHRQVLGAAGLCAPPQPQRPSCPSLCTCTGWGSSGTDTGTGTGMSSFNHGGFFRCKLLVLSCRTSDIVPRLSSGLGEGRNHSWEGAMPAGPSRAASRLRLMGQKPHAGQLPKYL